MANYGEVPQTKNYKAYYHLEDANDSSGNANNLTNTGSVAFNPAKFNRGADYGASNTTKDLSIGSTLGISGGAITMSFWVKITTQPSNQTTYLIFQGDNTTSQTEYHIDYIDTSGTKSFNFVRTRRNIADDTFLAGNITLSTTQFQHVAITYDPTGVGTISGYLNGSFLGSAASSGNGSGATTDDFSIGCDHRAAVGARTSGIFDEVIVEARTWSAAEMTRYYTQAVGRLCAQSSL